jgi:ATP-dependent exoDNAse (exonuclease V) alpha subunit
MLASKAIPTVKLTKIYRQAQNSLIITNAHRINKGEFPNLNGGRKSDFFFIEEADNSKIPGITPFLLEKDESENKTRGIRRVLSDA